MAKVIKDMAEFKALKSELILRYGDKLVTPTGAELAEIHEAITPLCRFAKVRADKMLTGMAQAWLRQEW